MEIKYKNTRLSTEQKIALAKDFNRGLSVPTLARKYKIHERSVYKVLAWVKTNIK